MNLKSELHEKPKIFTSVNFFSGHEKTPAEFRLKSFVSLRKKTSTFKLGKCFEASELEEKFWRSPVCLKLPKVYHLLSQVSHNMQKILSFLQAEKVTISRRPPKREKRHKKHCAKQLEAD